MSRRRAGLRFGLVWFRAFRHARPDRPRYRKGLMMSILQNMLDSCPEWLLDVLRDYRRLCNRPGVLPIVWRDTFEIARRRMDEYESTGEFKPLCAADGQKSLTEAEKVFQFTTWHDRLCRQMELRTQPIGLPVMGKDRRPAMSNTGIDTPEKLQELTRDSQPRRTQKRGKVFWGFHREEFSWRDLRPREEPVIRGYLLDIAEYFDKELTPVVQDRATADIIADTAVRLENTNGDTLAVYAHVGEYRDAIYNSSGSSFSRSAHFCDNSANSRPPT